MGTTLNQRYDPAQDLNTFYYVPTLGTFERVTWDGKTDVWNPNTYGWEKSRRVGGLLRIEVTLSQIARATDRKGYYDERDAMELLNTDVRTYLDLL